MLPLYAARLSDLKPGDFVIVECASCGHDGLIHPAALARLGLRPKMRESVCHGLTNVLSGAAGASLVRRDAGRLELIFRRE